MAKEQKGNSDGSAETVQVMIRPRRGLVQQYRTLAGEALKGGQTTTYNQIMVADLEDAMARRLKGGRQ